MNDCFGLNFGKIDSCFNCKVKRSCISNMKNRKGIIETYNKLVGNTPIPRKKKFFSKCAKKKERNSGGLKKCLD